MSAQTPDAGPPAPKPTATSTSATPPNEIVEPTTQQEQAKQDPSMPRVNYYTYSANDGTPVGLLRMVRHPQQGLWIDHVDQSGKWQDDPGALQDIYPLSDPETDESLWSQVDEVPEERAKQVYDLHFAADAKPPKQPPTATTQSQPASGSAESPSLIGPGKSVGGADPFYEGLPPDCQGGG